MAGCNCKNILQHLTLEPFFSSMNVCVKLAGVGLNVVTGLERHRAILDNGCHHTVIRQRY